MKKLNLWLLASLFVAVMTMTACSEDSTETLSATDPYPYPEAYNANKDLTVKPGDSFYDYCNGTWLAQNPIPTDPSKTLGGLYEAGDVMEKRVEELKANVPDLKKYYALVTQIHMQPEATRAYINAQKTKIQKPQSKEEAYRTIGKMYLNGQLGNSPDDVNAYAASSFFAVDRIVSFINSWGRELADYDFVIADRYTTSNIIHQMAKVAPDERDAFIDWLQDFEYNRLGLPAPDLLIFLDVDPVISQRLMLSRYSGDEEKKDIHEKAFGYLLSCRESALYAIAHLGWTVVSCDDGDNIRPIPEIADDILSIIKERFHA